MLSHRFVGAVSLATTALYLWPIPILCLIYLLVAGIGLPNAYVGLKTLVHADAEELVDASVSDKTLVA